MGAAFFYHLTQRPLEATLPMLLEKARGAGWRVAVRGTDEGRLDWLVTDGESLSTSHSPMSFKATLD